MRFSVASSMDGSEGLGDAVGGLAGEEREDVRADAGKQAVAGFQGGPGGVGCD